MKYEGTAKEIIREQVEEKPYELPGSDDEQAEIAREVSKPETTYSMEEPSLKTRQESKPD